VFVDSHCHLDFPVLADRLPQVLDAMRAQRVTHALCISVALETLPRVLDLARAHDNLYATVGVHPDQKDCPDPTVVELVELAARPKVVAIGETGLDYYWHKGDLEWQRERFRRHIRAARECGKPLVIHTREAAQDTLTLMREEGAAEVGGVMHCFTESLEVARGAMALGFHISFSGIVTFKNALALKAVAQAVPLDRLLIETDAPYLAPVPHRGRSNEPAWVVHVAEEIARLRNISVEAVAEASSDNYFRLFRIPRPQA
jgi:TatD DNase family protein